MRFLDRLNNIYVIDTKMAGFEHYMSAYLVKGSELALIDTGDPNRIETVREGIKAHGFSVSDISHIFVTHEHLDHGGNAAALLRESPNAKVYINRTGSEYFTNPAGINWSERMSPGLRSRFIEIESFPPSRVQYLKDGDVFDLGDGEKLTIMFAPGHQPGGVVIVEEKNMGLFINDLVGNYFADADALYPLNPLGSDHERTIESLRKLKDFEIAQLYLGHYGIYEKPRELIVRAINAMQRLLDIGNKYMREGKPESIAPKVLETVMPELEKLRSVRGEELYQYAAREHAPFQAQLFAKYCRERLSPNRKQGTPNS
jgi:glyoxylase-like metal-dependent hydrolase (beta-lactamase superfamily II)